jgi:[ribosomal protein S18]-alanine N-acetyltransferase
MLKPPAPYRLRAMSLSDIESVMAIEQTAFPTPWRASAYEYEVAHNRLAHYQVLQAALGDRPSRLIGYAGYWLLGSEAHVSTIALDQDWRGRGLGQLLLLNLLFLAMGEQASMVTLEVRRSNLVAQAVYQKFRFEIVGERKRYYQGKEDALLMTAEPLDREYRAFLQQQKVALFHRLERERPLPRPSGSVDPRGRPRGANVDERRST